MIWTLVLVLAIATCFLTYYQNRSFFIVSRALVLLGAIGFFGTALLPAAGGAVAWIELPAIMQTRTLSAPNGALFAATEPLQRIQRYSSDRQFELGWFIKSGAGGIWKFGITDNGLIVVVSARSHHVELFNPDGTYAREPIKLPRSLRIDYSDRVIAANEFSELGIITTEPKLVPNPQLPFFGYFLIAFANPVIGWLMFAIGLLLIELEKRIRAWWSRAFA